MAETVAMSSGATGTKPRTGHSITATPSSWTGSESRFLPGAVLADRYRIVALLGRGGMGEVYRADDLTLGQQVALKFLPEAIASSESAVERFRNEIRVARQVSHPNVCRVYDVGQVDGHLFLSMEYVDGEDLSSLLRRIGRLPEDKALEIARRLCAGLAAAHEKGILHRDLKPSNVMLDGRGQVLLTDFGLAGLANEIEGAEVRNGTPAYMAPEQLEGREVTVRSDIYSLGLVLYEVFTGKRPYEANTLAELVQARTRTTPATPSSLVRDLDPAVERVILRCLEADAARRPTSALAVAAALPGGDPLAAALAAGETPSPEMVAAAGEGAGLSARAGVSLFLAVIAAVVAVAFLVNRSSALERIPALSPEVLAEKAREVVQKAGYNSAPLDDAAGFEWRFGTFDYLREHQQNPRWPEILAGRVPLLVYWRRQSDDVLTAVAFHNDHLTPDLVDQGDPPFDTSGMVNIQLDAQGRLIRFEAMPPQLQTALQSPPPSPDWSPLFAAAAIDPAKLQTTEPLWTWQATSDQRTAWTGTWPGTSYPLRVEAASLRGKPIAFALMGPWSKPSRNPSPQEPLAESVPNFFFIGLAIVLLIAAPLLARRNLLRGRGDKRGALRLAWFVFIVQMAIWIFQAHFAASIGTMAMFFIAVCTSLFYAAVVWTIYLAL
ncbi:MAG TPA: serine/threonine-protein kinase, partial [Bryobacteraceae bacterium]|nr:serine/threonine-protein kinase [Bryobacteraceae bacterium]